MQQKKNSRRVMHNLFCKIIKTLIQLKKRRRRKIEKQQKKMSFNWEGSLFFCFCQKFFEYRDYEKFSREKFPNEDQLFRIAAGSELKLVFLTETK